MSRAGLEGVGAGVNIFILAEDAIIVDTLTAGPLALQTAAGSVAEFSAAGTSLTFNDQTNSITTAGGGITLNATTSAAIGGLSSGGGDITGTAQVAPHVKVFDGATGATLKSFFAYAPSVPGVRVGAVDHNNDGTFDIITGCAIGSHVKVFDGTTLAEQESVLAFGPDCLGGVYVGGA